MIKQKGTIDIKNKLINHVVSNGQKNKSEIILIKSVKFLQKISKKSFKKIFQLALVSNTPVFKLNIITNKKKKKKKQKVKIIPAFVSSKMSRISFAIKFIVNTVKKKKTQAFFKSFQEEVLVSSQNRGVAIENKKNTQKQALLNRHLFKYYRWH